MKLGLLLLTRVASTFADAFGLWEKSEKLGRNNYLWTSPSTNNPVHSTYVLFTQFLLLQQSWRVKSIPAWQQKMHHDKMNPVTKFSPAYDVDVRQLLTCLLEHRTSTPLSTFTRAPVFWEKRKTPCFEDPRSHQYAIFTTRPSEGLKLVPRATKRQ